MNLQNIPKKKVFEKQLYKIVINNLNNSFVSLGMPFVAENTSEEGGDIMPDITIYWKKNKSIASFVEFKVNLGIQAVKNCVQAISCVKSFLTGEKERDFSCCVLLDPCQFTIFCAYRYRGNIISFQLVKVIKLENSFQDGVF
jgi:hypothetical protein